MSIRSEESEIYQGKGRGGVLGKGKGTYIRNKEREVTSGERKGSVSGKGKGRMSRVKDGRYIRCKEGDVYQG